MESIDFLVLGPFEVIVRGRASTPTAAKQRALLLRLLVDANRFVSSDELVDALWGHRPPSSAANLLQVYVSHVRRALGRDLIETRAGGYVTHLGPNAVDAWRFERQLLDGQQLLAVGNAALAASVLRRAETLWRGRAFGDAADAEFARGEARRLEELRLVCIEERLAAELALGHDAVVVADASALAEEQPLRERARRHLAVALYRRGQQAEALAELRDAGAALRDQLGLEPSAELRGLERAMLLHDPALASPRSQPARPSLPEPATPLIGRARELRALHRLVMRPDVRLLTVVGAGGSGKTRLAIALARESANDFANGVVFVPLAELRDPGLVVPTIARAFGIEESGGVDTSAALGESIRERELLLVVDNIEHVVEAAPALSSLARDAPRLTIVATSRRVLHVAGEHVLPLDPLAVDDALALFLARASAIRPAFAVDAAREAVVRDICRRVDCLPLAVELAAARTSTLSVEELSHRLSRRLGVLTHGMRDLPARHQTLRATLQWSTDLLNEHTRRPFARLGVFSGGCTLEAAETVAGATLDTVDALLQHSLLRREESGGETRLAMLETVREHALELLRERGDFDVSAAAHAAYFADLVSRAELKGPSSATWLVRLDAELDNLRTASDWAVANGDLDLALRIATHLYRYWYQRGLYREGRGRIEKALAAAQDDPALRALALRALGGLVFLLGDLDAAEGLALQGIDAGTTAHTLEPVMGCHTVLGLVAQERGDLARARVHVGRSGELAARLGLDEDVVIANSNLGEISLRLGDLADARRRWERTLTWHDEREQHWGIAFARLGLGAVALEQRRTDEATKHFDAARRSAERVGARHQVALALIGLAATSSAHGQAEEAAGRLGRASALLDAIGATLTPSEARLYRDTTAAVEALLGTKRLSELLASARQESNL